MLLDTATFTYEQLWMNTPLVVRFSNLQVWAVSRIIPTGKNAQFSADIHRSSYSDKIKEVIGRIVPFEALNQLLACIRYVGSDVKPLTLLEVADSMSYLRRELPHLQLAPD